MLCSCSISSSPPIREEVVNTGPVVIDPSNPFVIGNQFLEAEAKKSDILKKFINFRGKPSAVEVRKHFLGSWKIYLFYLDRREGYLLDESAEDWIVRGPQTIPKEILSSLKAGGGAAGRSAMSKEEENSEVPLIEAGEPAEGDLLEKESLPSLRSTEKQLNPLRSEIKPLPPRIKSAASTAGKKSVADIPEDSVDAFSEDSAPSAAGLRQVAPNLQEAASGDLIHTVSFPGETLRIITAWYTGDVNSAGRLARINGIGNPDKLVFSQTIRIPRYMLTNTAPLPEEEITRYNENLKHH